jgi:hypothetical protein
MNGFDKGIMNLYSGSKDYFSELVYTCMRGILQIIHGPQEVKTVAWSVGCTKNIARSSMGSLE